MKQGTIAQLLVARLHARGVRRMFGVPGGGSSLDVIEAGAAVGIDFVLTRTESAAVMMAAASATLTGAPGVAITTKGPGTAAAANGVACAALDRAAVILVTDGFSEKESAFVTHQVFDQRAMLEPITRASTRLEGPSPSADLDAMLDAAMTPPLGPVLIELTSENARRQVEWETATASRPPVASSAILAERNEPSLRAPDDASRAAAVALLARARRPVIVAGLECREPRAAEATRALAEALGCPVFTTYQAKGVVADRHPLYVGGFTCGSAESSCVGAADLIVLCGLDPVELLRQPWRYSAPVIDIACIEHPVHYVRPAAGVYGSLAASLTDLAGAISRKHWTLEEIRSYREQMRSALQYPATPGLGPQAVVELAAEASRALDRHPRITVDAGAHMFSAMAFWPCEAPNDVLISNGLATMAFAVPAAIAAALESPERVTIAFTGDGGLFMCLGELSTAVQVGARLIVVVFNDASLSLIDIKQQQRALPARGVRWTRPDFAAAMQAMGGSAYRADTAAAYGNAIAAALHGGGPALIDVTIDPTGYPDQLKALRG